MEELDWALCSTLAKLYHKRQVKYSRYHHFRVLHVTDAIACPIKVLVLRLYDITPPCRMLFYMREGLEWEEKAIKAIVESGRSPEYVQRQRVQSITLNDTVFAFVKTPDYESPDELIEIKWTRFKPAEIRNIFYAKFQIGRKVWGNSFTYPDEAVDLLVWPSWLYQVYGYLYWNTLRGEPHPEKVYIFAQRGDHVDLIRVEFRDMRVWRKKFEARLNRIAKLFKEYHDWLFAPYHRLESIVYEDLAPVYRELWRNWEYYSEVEYQCRLCPLLYTGTCPGLIGMRKFKFWVPDELEVLRNIASWSEHLQEYLETLTIHWNGEATSFMKILARAKRDDYPKLLRELIETHNSTDVIANMIREAMKDLVYAFRRRPPRGRIIFWRP